jgi:tRNA(Ile2)-agmatinylcytidine synthase
MAARQMIVSEPPGIEQIWATNQGTDAHLLPGRTGTLDDLRSYTVPGTITSAPKTRAGGHVSFVMCDGDVSVRCMAYEPTKNFRHTIRQLLPGDRVIAAGSYKKGSINLEKLKIVSLARRERIRPPLCPSCNKRMTSNGTGKGFKCKKCIARSDAPEITTVPRSLVPGWYEVPPTARRHLAKPLCRGDPGI